MYVSFKCQRVVDKLNIAIPWDSLASAQIVYIQMNQILRTVSMHDTLQKTR